MRSRALQIASLLALAVMAPRPLLASITTATLRIEGATLEVVTTAVTTGIDLPVTIQTSFAGKQNDEAPLIEGLTAVGELTGPGLDVPIVLVTAPGHRFEIPGLPREGAYTLQNVRLMNGGEMLQYATPAAATIIVADLLQTKLTVRQLSPDEIRARGIPIDARNFDVYEFSFTMIVDGREVIVPFPVIVDPRTHQVQSIPTEHPYTLPPPGLVEPPRWTAPQVVPFEWPEEEFLPEPGKDPVEKKRTGAPIKMPAAIVMPGNLATLHQFFAVSLLVTNGAPSSSSARLEDIRGTIHIPTALRSVKTNPEVAFGQAVPVVDPVSGTAFLVAQAQGEAEWTLEGLKAGTHRIDFDLRAVLRQEGQPDTPLRAAPSAAIVIHDPRFQINFSHPATVRKGIEYSTWTFISNMSPSEQSLSLTSDIPPCEMNPSANVCRLTGAGGSMPAPDLITIPPGEMKAVEYRLRAGVTGQVFATAGSVSDTGTISASVRLEMGVSESGIPLSPATLVLPHYAQYVSPAVVDANLQLLGLGYSIATAPLNQHTAKFPRVIATDVFRRAVDIARAGQRTFITDGDSAAKRDSLTHLALDLLGNDGYELREWDELRRIERSGRSAGASVARELESSGFSAGATWESFIDSFASATAHRPPFLAAFAHGSASGTRPYALALTGLASGRRMAVPNEASEAWIREIPFGDLSRFDGAGEMGELALLGRWTEDVAVVITPAVDGPFALDILLPDSVAGRLRHARFDLNGTSGQSLSVTLTRGASALNALLPGGGVAAVAQIQFVEPPALRPIAARQDLHLDPEGHKVSILFNRSLGIPSGIDLRSRIAGSIDFDRDGIRYQAPRPVSAAALQDDARTINATFDHALSVNATYRIEMGDLVDPLTAQPASFAEAIQPKIDNDAPAGIVYGKVLKGDNSAVAAADVVLRQFLPGATGEPKGAPQYDVSQPDGAFLFEFVRREMDLGWTGAYRLEAFSAANGHAQLDGAVRLPGRVHVANLQFLGRGAAEGTVRYSDGAAVAGATVVVGSTMFEQFRTATADANGFYRVDDLPVGPLTFSARDASGEVTFAASEIATPGQLVTQNLSIFRRPFPGTGRVHGIVRRSDTNAPVAGARVGVSSQGYGLVEGVTDQDGRFDFADVPAGFVTLLASEWSVSREAVAVDLDLRPDEVKEANLLLFIAPVEPTTTVTGEVWREKTTQPGTYERVAGALVKIDGYRIAAADAEGRFSYEDLPVRFGGREISAWDPVTQRVKSAPMPTLTQAGPNHVAIFIAAVDRGKGTIRVRVLNASGTPVSGYRVLVPGFPPDVLPETAPGVYELKDVTVGTSQNVWAVPAGARPESGADLRPYGDQFASGNALVAFSGQIAALTLRLPGEGTVRVKVRSQFDLISDVQLSYPIWWEGEQKTIGETFTASTSQNGEAGQAVFSKVPALSRYSVASAHPQYGSARANGTLAYQGDFDDVILQLNTLASVRGTVYAIDGVTPVPGATVRIQNGRSDPGPQVTGPAGTFEFVDQPSSTLVTLSAEITQEGIYRVGTSFAKTPANGGVVENASIILRRRGSIDGRVVYKSYRHFDPDNPANNVADDTPNDLTDNAPAPLANFVLRELDYPRRSFGSAGAPFAADGGGRFSVANVFTGALRVSAWDPGNQELRGDWTGRLDDEGATTEAIVAIGAGGVGSIQVTVVDPNQSYGEVANAEVSVFTLAGKEFDFTSADANGEAIFDSLPVGSYLVSAYSKSLGKTSRSEQLAVTAGGLSTARLELEFSGTVDGTLTDPEEGSAPVPGSHVRLVATSYQTQSTTDTAGLFLFEGVREGTFTLHAKDTDTNRRASAERTLSVLDPHRTVNLELEPIETLHFTAYLPDDTGGNSGILAPPLRVETVQRCWTDLGHKRHCDYERQLQGNPLQFPGVFENGGYEIGVFEPGRVERAYTFYGNFPTGTAAQSFVWVQPAYGEIRVTVTQGGAPASGARVTVTASRNVVVAYTDGSGVAIARGLRLGGAYVQVSSLDGRFTGAASTQILRQSVPAELTIALGAYAGVTGLVEAEEGGPSAGTRVVATYGSSTAEVRTGEDGRYTILGIPTPSSGTTAVSIVFVGPDDTTIGGQASRSVSSADTLVSIPTVRLDATPPQLESIVPADGASAVSPDSSIVVTFSERLQSASISTANFQLIAADGSGGVLCGLSSEVLADGRFAVTMKPPVPSSGFPLRSNTLYRVIVSGNVADLTGHRIPSTRGFTFTTSDYAEPRVQKVLPASPIPRETTFEFRFNEVIDPAPWQNGGAATFSLQKLLAPGGASAAVERALEAHAFVEPATGMSLLITPDESNPIEPESFYRVTFSGVRDLQGNVLGQQTHHFFSFDEIAPHATLVNPAAGIELVSGSEYTLQVELRNGSADGAPATDVALVRYAVVDAGGGATQFAAVTASPWSTKIVAPDAPAEGLTYRVGVQATDASGNEGPLTSTSWLVRPNAAPKNVVITTQQPSAYPTKTVGASVAFEDEGAFATVTLRFDVPRSDGSTETKSFTKSVSRSSGGSWALASFTHSLPVNATAGGLVTLTATVTDVRGLTSTPVTGTIGITADTTQPVIVSITPAAETVFANTAKYTIEAIVSDAETTVTAVSFRVDGQHVATASSSVGSVPGTQKFRSVQVETRSKAEDAAIPIVVTAVDANGNVRSTTFDVTYKGVNDPDAPKVSWLSPIDRGAIPANASSFPLKLRLRVVDQDVRSVQFVVGGSSPVTLDGVATSTTDYEVTHTFTTPSPGELTITAIVEDTVASHRVELPIDLDVIAVDHTFTDPRAITSADVASFEGDSIALLGAAAVLAPQVPLSLSNLLVLNGARVETLSTTITREFRLDVTVNGTLYVDGDSSIDVSSRGYVGGWANTSDGKNNDRRGRTVGNSTTGGADERAQASHGGLGGIGTLGVTNAPYGSIQSPVDLGSGGGGNAGGSLAGAPGGGAIVLRGSAEEGDASRIVLAGTLRADGGNGVSINAAGSGGSVLVAAKDVRFGPKTVVSANGGDDDGGNPGSWGAGGGRIAVNASTKLDLSTAIVEARGGRNLGQPEQRSVLDGGAGTVFVRKPGQEQGELTVSSFDTRHPTSLHLARPTPLGRIGTGAATAIAPAALTDASRTFDLWMVGEELVLAGDPARSFTVTGVSADGRTLQTDPNDGNLLEVAASQTESYAGLLLFDKVTAGPRALAVFDDHVDAAGAIDDRGAIGVDASAVVVLRDEVPTLSIETLPAAGGGVIQDDSVDVTFDATSTSGISSVRFDWSPGAAPQVATFSDSPLSVAGEQAVLPVPAATAVGPATLKVVAFDRAGRSFEAGPLTYGVSENAPPVIQSFSVEPASLSIYPGHSVMATVVAADDLSVRSVAFDARLNGTSIATSSSAPDAPLATRSLTVPIANEVAGGSTLVLSVSVGDGFPGRNATSATQTVSILSDTAAPMVAVSTPVAGAAYRETVDDIPVRVIATDADVAVKEVAAQLDGGVAVALTRVTGTDEWRADVEAPAVDGSANVQRLLTVTARDYAGNATVSEPIPLTIQPVTDPNAPILRTVCASDGAFFPPGASVKVRVSAVQANAENPVQGVEISIDGVPIAVTALTGNEYEATFAIPSGATEGTEYLVRVIGRSAGGATSDFLTRFSVAVPTAATISTSITIDPTNTTYDGKTVLITGGTVTIRGAHVFDRLMLLGGTIVAPTGEKLDLSTIRGLHAACGTTIDMTGRGSAGSSPAGNRSGGSRIGVGGPFGGAAASAFGSLYFPFDAGGGGNNGGHGGGVIRLTASSAVLDGTIRSNGNVGGGAGGGGAGGSIWIRVDRLMGGGKVEANGGTAFYGSGGGGAIAFEFTDPVSIAPSAGSTCGATGSTLGGPGSVYKYGPGSTFGDLEIDFAGLTGFETTLPSLGLGLLQAGTLGSNAVTDRSTDIPASFVGHWVEISDSTGTLKGTWRVSGVSGKTLTLQGVNVAIGAGDRWQGVYRFDNLRLRGVNLSSADPIRVAESQSIEAWAELSAVTARNLVVAAGTSLSSKSGVLTLIADESIEIQTGAVLDLTGRGGGPGTTSGNRSGGSHIGIGGVFGGSASTSTGSVYRPAEPGGGGQNGSSGGGVIRIDAAALHVDGVIRANGNVGGSVGGSGAGGSVWITAPSVTGAGTIVASGGSATYGSGGGGAITVDSTGSSITPTLAARSGSTGSQFGGAGSIVTFVESSTHGSLTVDNSGFAVGSSQSTVFPSLGRGDVVSVSSGSTVVTERSSIPGYFAGHWVDIFSPSGTLRGTWRIASVTGGSLSLEGNPVVFAGDSYRGVYLFDNVTLRSAKLLLIDDLRGTRVVDGSSSITINDGPAFDVTKLGQVVVESRADGDFITAPIGAVSDPSTPITLTATNTRTNQTFTANAAANGSFSIVVSGEPGDTFRLYARDSNAIPARSASVSVGGSITNVNAMAALSVSPSTFVGGNSATAVARLLLPARNAGGTVTLSSSSPSVQLPAQVVVPAGSSSVSFTVTTSPVDADTEVTITAATNGTSRSATVTLLEDLSALAQLVVTPAAVVGGTSVNGTVTLGAPAPVGGALVALTSDDSLLAHVPDFVEIAEGTTSATFTVLTRGVPVDAAVKIAATFGNTLEQTLTLSACTDVGSVTQPSTVALGQLWLDESLPAGAVQSGDGVIDTTQAAMGNAAIHLWGSAAGTRTFDFTGAPALAVTPNDLLVLYALVDPCDPPRQLFVEWQSGATEYRASWGESRIEPTVTHLRAGAMPRAGEWVRLELLAKSLGITANTSLNGLSIRALDGEIWIDAIGMAACSIGTPPAPALSPNEIVWFDDDAPAGAVLAAASGVTSAWTWDVTQAAAGSRSHVEPLRSGRHEHSLTLATPMVPGQGDVLYTYVLLDPCNPPREVMLQWRVEDGSGWEHRAYWGDDLISLGSAGSVSRFRVGPLPKAGGWVRLEVPAAAVGVEGKAVTGHAFGLYDGKAWFDRAGRIPRVNIALGKLASQASYFTGRSVGDAQLVVDGDLQNYNFTNSQAEAWWELDLGASYPIESVSVYNRQDCCSDRLSKFWLLVSDTPFGSTNLATARLQSGVSAMRLGGSPLNSVEFSVNRPGRYLRVQLEGANYLHMREVQVWAPVSALRRNVAIGTPASQSSTPSVLNGAAQGVAGLANVYFTATSNELRPWWQTDLGSIQKISSVTLSNRFDCCPERMANSYLFVSDSPFTSTDLNTTLTQPGVSAFYFATVPATHDVSIERTGRFVRVQLTGTNFLHMSEVQVWSQETQLHPMSRPSESPPQR